MKKAVFVTLIMTHYRERFHELVRARLADADVAYHLVYSPPMGAEAAKSDTINLPWAQSINSHQIGKAVIQPFLGQIRDADLVVIGQENRMMTNYVLQMLPRRLRPAIAFWGHGRSFQSRNPDGAGERWKRFWATKVDWWFGYTDETRRHVESLGFPAERITVFNNSVDTSALRAQDAAVTPDRLATLRADMGLAGRHVGVFVGGIYPDKRMPFLVETADLIRARIPDFEMIVTGGGSDLPVIRDLATTRPWIHVTGPRFGEDKVALMKLGHVFMMPGLMGLAILDAGTVGLPIATTAYPWHSPEIAYLSPGENGVMVENWQDPAAYGDAVADILLDPARQQAMSAAARAMAERYSIEAMAANFANGVLKALAA